MKLNRITIEHALFLLILIIALGVRILRIGEVPLSDFEAEHALQAFQVSKGNGGDFSPGPAYSLMTGVVFFLLTDDNAYARLWPILTGCCLVIFAYLIRSLIGRKAALIMAIGIALDPSLVAFSRIAGSEMMAVGFGMLALGLAYNRKPILSGIFGGLMILSGPSALQGMLGFGLAWLIGDILSRSDILDRLPSERSSENTWIATKSALLAAAVVILAVGTLFFLFPQGLDALTSIIPAYLGGWISISGIPASKLLASLVLYNPIALIFGVVGIIQGWLRRETVSQWLSLWVGVTFVLVIVYPSREVINLSWLLVPLWGIAAIEIAKYFRIQDAELIPALGQAALILLLMALGWLNLAGLSLSVGDMQTYQLRWAVIGGTIVLGGITTLLIGLGWSAKTAKQGLVWGLLLGLGFYNLSSTWALSQLRPNGEQELLAPIPMAKNSGDLQTTLGDLSEWRTGMRNTLDVVLTTSAPSLRWEMRNWPEARYLSILPSGELPSVIITSEDQPEPNLAIGYRGQDFAWWTYPNWEGVLPDNWPGWLVNRDASQIDTNIILWARADLFPGGVLSKDESSAQEMEGESPSEQLPVR
jgi:hypothetical protein